MNNTSTYTYSFSTIKDEFYNDFKGKTIKKKFVDVVDDYDIQPQRPEICPFCSKGKMYIKSTNHCNLKDYSTGPELYIARVKYHTYRCSECHKSLTEEIDFRVPKKQFTWRFLKQALYLILGNGITIKKAAEFMHCAPSLIKEIHKNYLNKVAGTLKPKAGTYSEYIVVDEFLLHKGHRYCTMVLDGRTGCLLYLEPGKGKRQLKHFFDFVGPDFMNHVKACGMDMNCSFNAAIKQYYPHIAVVYDYFHLVSWYNTKVMAPLRKMIYKSLKKEADDTWLAGDHETSKLISENAEKVFNSRFLLPSNYKTLAAKDAANKAYNKEVIESFKLHGEEIPKDYKFRKENNVELLKKVLDANQSLQAVYELKEGLKAILELHDIEQLKGRLKQWVYEAKKLHIRQVTCFLKTIEKRWNGIVSRAEFNVSSGVIEGTNGFVKAARRASYGFNDFDYFGLLIWYQTHENPRKRNNKYSARTIRHYKRAKAHNRRFNKARLYTSPRNEHGEYLVV